ncbi:hypothetical protein CSA17_04695 [bacterium DOLJORAL78_65_58]|nr:MAG: hypothetical protein CSB20_01700 [bacterium DOLZORAL124_64_63]PIE75955.1 MAG: hypothetical protein CSA17_04695 [bacterium DOLJORAL78_65_58]
MEKKVLIALLVEIAELEQLRMEAEQTLGRNDEIRFSLQELQEEYEQDAAAAAAANQGAQATVRGLDKEIHQVQELLKVKREMEIGLTDRRALRALREEISGLERRLEALEERTIALLEQEEAMGQAARESAEETAEHKTRAQREVAERARQSAELVNRLGHIDAELTRLVGMLPTAERRHVERLRGKLDRSVVHLQDGACLGCFHSLPVQQALDVEQGRALVRCPSCMRYVVHRSWN